MRKTAMLLAFAVMTARPAMAADLSPAIRAEGLGDSHAMAYATNLADGIGARLMGSPNMRKAYGWAQRVLAEIGAKNIHLEDIGEFGLSWQLDSVWLRMTAPDIASFVVQASPWSVASNGPRQGQAIAVEINDTRDFERYRGRLSGKVVLLGPLRPTPFPMKPFAYRWSRDDLIDGHATEAQRKYFISIRHRWQTRIQEAGLLRQERLFFASEKVLAVVLQSPDTENNGGTGDLFVQGTLSEQGWTKESQPNFPVLVTTSENFGRAWRLVEAGQRVDLEFDVEARIFDQHEHGFNVIADLPGSDPKLKDEYVMLGAHLDSWSAGTGATDNGAGLATCLEALRVLKAVGAHPRRTIRIALFAGEEEGLLGSKAYVAQHLAYSTATKPAGDGEIIARGDLKTLPGYRLLSAYFNIDRGSGKVRGLYAGGNQALRELMTRHAEPLADLGVETVVPERSYPADQSSFEKVSLPGIAVVQDLLDYYSRARHSNLDTVEHLSAPDLSQMATVMAILALDVANDDNKVPRSSPPEMRGTAGGEPEPAAGPR